MLAAELPFDGPNMESVIREVRSCNIVYKDFFSSEVVNFLKKIITPDPNKRLTIEQIKQDPWFKIDYHPTLPGKVAEGFTPHVTSDPDPDGRRLCA